MVFCTNIRSQASIFLSVLIWKHLFLTLHHSNIYFISTPSSPPPLFFGFSQFGLFVLVTFLSSDKSFIEPRKSTCTLPSSSSLILFSVCLHILSLKNQKYSSEYIFWKKESFYKYHFLCHFITRIELTNNFFNIVIMYYYYNIHYTRLCVVNTFSPYHHRHHLCIFFCLL